MPPPNTPEEFFEEEYQQRRNSAVANAARRHSNLPPHYEDLAESAAELEHSSHPNTSQNESRRTSEERRLSIEQSFSRSRTSSRSHSPSRARRRSRDGVLARSRSPSTIGPVGTNYNSTANYGTDYAYYLQHAATMQGAGLANREQSSSPSQSGDAPTVNDVHNVESPARHLPHDIFHAQQDAPTTHLPEFPVQSAHRERELDYQEPEQGRWPNTQSPRQWFHLPSSVSLPREQAPVTAQRRHGAKTPKMDWHALEYIGPYDENLDCPICRSPLVKPEITTCFHIFCHRCLAQSLQHGNRCPIDRNPIQFFETSHGRVPARPAPHIIVNQLDNLQVRCPNRRCDHTSARSLIKHHYKYECSFTKIPCPDPSCGKLVTRRESEDSSCLHKAVDCVYCGKLVDLAALDDHYDTDCNQKELMCEHCLAAIPRHRHGTHVANCSERRLECKYKTSGCTYTSKKKDFGDHERTCLYGMVMRMDRAHRADMDNMLTVLQDSQDRVRKLESALDARPPAVSATQAVQAPVGAEPTQAQISATLSSIQPPLPSYPLDGDDEVRRYITTANAVATAEAQDSAGGMTQPGTPPPGGGPSDNDNDRMGNIVAYIDIFDAKVENLERYLGEIDARQVQLFMNELGPLKDQILEMRNSMGHMSMYVRWLMESFRQTTKRSVGLRGGGDDDGGVTGASTSRSSAAGGRATPSPAGASSGAATGSAGPSQRGPSGPQGSQGAQGPPTILRGPTGGMALPMRRMSDRENPPRL